MKFIIEIEIHPNQTLHTGHSFSARAMCPCLPSYQLLSLVKYIVPKPLQPNEGTEIYVKTAQCLQVQKT